MLVTGQVRGGVCRSRWLPRHATPRLQVTGYGAAVQENSASERDLRLVPRPSGLCYLAHSPLACATWHIACRGGEA